MYSRVSIKHIWDSKVLILMMVVMCFIVASTIRSRALIERKVITNTPAAVYVLSENSVDRICTYAFGRTYNLFDGPVAICILPNSDASCQNATEYFFILDKSQNLIRYFRIDADINCVREIRELQMYGNGRGSGVGQFDGPEAITISPGDPCITHYLYVLDTGNNRIEKIRLDPCVQNPTHVGYIYSGEVPGYGALNEPMDIDYCDLYGDYDTDNDFLVVADTYNHRILALRPDGTVLWSMGGPSLGDGVGQFSYPIAVTATKMNFIDNSAAIFVADRGNNRIVRLDQGADFSITWTKTLELPSDIEKVSYNMGGYSMAGLEDIEVDADVDPVNSAFSGVFVLDSRKDELLQLDYKLESIIQRFSNFNTKWVSLHDMDISRGEMAILSTFTTASGMELYSLKASIYDLQAFPNPFTPPLEWVMASMIISGAGVLNVWVETSIGEFVDSLMCDWPVMPGVEYALWDGRDHNDSLVSAGTYKIIANLEDNYWDYSERKEISVETSPDMHLKILVSKPDLRDPDWAPDGSKIAYSATGNIWCIDLTSLDAVNLTGDLNGKQLMPSWSPLEDKIAFTREISPYVKYWNYIMDSDGSNKAVLTDTTGNPAWIWEKNPKWLPAGQEISYVKRSGSGAYSLYKHRFEDSEDSLLFSLEGWMELFETSWSPHGDKIAYLKRPDGLEELSYICTYDLQSDFQNQLSEAPDSARSIKGISWSPDSQKLLYTQFNFWASSYLTPAYRWSVLTMPSSGGTPIMVSGLTSSDAFAHPGIDWSPDGTKIVIPVEGISTVDLVIADYMRSANGAFPSAFITTPLSNDTIQDEAIIIGTVDNNIGVNQTTLSSLDNYYFQWGYGANPETWSSYGIELACSGGNCNTPVINDTLACWNTGVVESGLYTVRLVASDGVDSNVVSRRVYVSHKSVTVMKGGSGDYASIQAAMDAVEKGDTIKVYPGLFQENISLGESIYLVAAGDSVRICGGNNTAVSIVNHEYPCVIRGLIIEDGSYPTGRGLYISNASPVIINCRISNNNYSQGDGGGIAIGGSSFPKLYDCTISNNVAINGGGVAMLGYGDAKPIAEFISTEFVGNTASQGYGGAIYIHYDSALDTTFQQPSFSACRIQSNTSKYGGSAIYIDNCHRPIFSLCSISSNNISSIGSPDYGTVDGYQSAATIINCTFADNNRSSTGNYYVLSLDGNTGPNKPIRVERSLIANNDGPGIDTSHLTKYEVNNCDFFGNTSNDDYWLTHGVNNLNEDPAFYEEDNNPYYLYAFSPCSESVSEVGRIGAFDAIGVPAAIVESAQDTSSRMTLCTCPQGDADSLIAFIDLNDEEITRDLESMEFELLRPYGSISIFEPGPIIADSAATVDNQYCTTITHKYISGCGSDSVSILLDGLELKDKAGIIVRSPDMNGDGNVNISDFSAFGLSYAKCEGDEGFNLCCDFNADSCVDLQDWSAFGLHYNHKDPYQPQGVSPQIPLESEISVQIILTEVVERKLKRKLLARIVLENVPGYSAMVLALNKKSRYLEYSSFKPNEELHNPILVAPIERDGISLIFIGHLGAKSPSSSSINLGTIEFDITNNATLNISKDDFKLIIGDVLSPNGEVQTIRGVDRAITDPSVVVNHNYLANACPNPFNPMTTIEYSITNDTRVDLSIFNVSGQLVRSLVNKNQKSNIYRVMWDGKDNKGNPVASGVYFCRIKTYDFTQTRKLTLLK